MLRGELGMRVRCVQVNIVNRKYVEEGRKFRTYASTSDVEIVHEMSAWHYP